MTVKPLTAIGTATVVVVLLAYRMLPAQAQEALSLTGLLLFFCVFVGALIYRKMHPKNDSAQKLTQIDKDGK